MIVEWHRELLQHFWACLHAIHMGMLCVMMGMLKDMHCNYVHDVCFCLLHLMYSIGHIVFFIIVGSQCLLKIDRTVDVFLSTLLCESIILGTLKTVYHIHLLPSPIDYFLAIFFVPTCIKFFCTIILSATRAKLQFTTSDMLCSLQLLYKVIK